MAKKLVSSGSDYPRGSEAWAADYIGLALAVILPNVLVAIVYGASKQLAYYAAFSGVVTLGIFVFLCMEAVKYERSNG